MAMKYACRFLGFFFFMVSVNGFSQDAFIGELNVSTTSRPSIYPISDGGWYVYIADETILIRQNQCGEVIWSRNLDIVNDNCCIGDAAVVSSNDDITILTRGSDGVLEGYQITQLSSLGVVNWSKLYKNNGQEYYPYSLVMDLNENLIAYGIETPIGGGSGFLTVMKIDLQGNSNWSKKIADGYVWGATMATQDTGVLIRSGDQFMKLDRNGDLQWSQQFQSPGTYYYLAPIEVDDGYIFTKNISGGSDVGFYKVDKLGNLLWNVGKFTSFTGTPLPLRSTGSNTFVGLFNIAFPNGISPTIVEFDKDLNILSQNSIQIPSQDMFISDLRISVLNKPIITGTSGAFIQNVMYAKLSSEFQVGCDFIEPLVFTDLPVTSTNRLPAIYGLQMDETVLTVTFNAPIVSTTEWCSFTETRSLYLGNDTTICPDSAVTLSNKTSANFQEYLWSTGEVSPTISVNSPGLYWVETSNPCINQVFFDTIEVFVFNFPDPSNFIYDTVLCGSSSVVLNATIPNGKYKWQNGLVSPLFTVTAPGNYFVDITSVSCEKRFNSTVSSCEDIVIPNIFTPNGDGINDYFEISYLGSQSFSIQIFNRWGHLVFESPHPGYAWDGRSNSGEIHPNGVYFYVISVGENQYQGNLTLNK